MHEGTAVQARTLKVAVMLATHAALHVKKREGQCRNAELPTRALHVAVRIRVHIAHNFYFFYNHSARPPTCSLYFILCNSVLYIERYLRNRMHYLRDRMPFLGCLF